MKKELQERIEKLKKPELAQPFGLRTDEERAILRQADKANCIVFTDQNDWIVASGAMDWRHTHTYILKPHYKPKPEYIEIELEAVNKGVWLKDAAPGWTGECSTYKAATHEDFICFHFIDGSETVVPGNVPNWRRLNPHKTMYVRFVRSI